jgi:hypothetical protein
MSKRSRRLGKKNELRAVEEAIGASLGKSAVEVAKESGGVDGKVRKKSTVSQSAGSLREARNRPSSGSALGSE